MKARLLTKIALLLKARFPIFFGLCLMGIDLNAFNNTQLIAAPVSNNHVLWTPPCFKMMKGRGVLFETTSFGHLYQTTWEAVWTWKHSYLNRNKAAKSLFDPFSSSFEGKIHPSRPQGYPKLTVWHKFLHMQVQEVQEQLKLSKKTLDQKWFSFKG